MNKTMALRRELQRKLSEICSAVSYKKKPENFTYPYITFEASELTHDYGKTLYQLEVNVIDHGDNSSTAEDTSDLIQIALNKYYFINPYIEFTVYRGERQAVEEDDKQIIRRRMLFEVHLHDMKGE